MKKVLIFILTSALAFGLKAQEKPIAKIHYEFKHVNDTTQRENFLKDEVVTYLGQEGSYYTSYSAERVSEDIKKQRENSAFNGVINLIKSTTAISRSYILFPKEEKLLELAQVTTDRFIIEAEYPKQEWEIHDETKDIGGYSCQKASTSFKGRNYTAWFTTELPFSFGPWKLHGLPGLILTAVDDKNEVSFEYIGFDKMPEDTFVRIAPSEDAILSTEVEIAKIEKAFKDNPEAYFKSKQNRISASGAKVTTTLVGRPSSSSGSLGGVNAITSVNVKKDSNYKPSNVTNNPIELKP